MISADFKSYIEELRANSIKAKKRLLDTNFTTYPDNATREQKTAFVRQFVDLIGDLALFPDEQVLNKLYSLDFANRTLRWMVDIDEILVEMIRLLKIGGFLFEPLPFLVAINGHLSVKLKISMFEDFELIESYNNSETNIVFSDYDKRFNRRKYQEQKNEEVPKTEFEGLMNEQIDFFKNITNEDEATAKAFFVKMARGDTSYFISELNKFQCFKISKRQVYLELFPLLKMILKDVEMLSEVDYHKKKESNYDADYTKYRISRVKKILKK
jgi:hypothetical protein